MGTENDRERFVRLWDGLARRLGLGVAVGSAVGRELLEAYTGEDRHYHGVRHILTMLNAIECLEHQFQDPDAVRLAAFFHDVVYLPGSTDNERSSAERLRSSLRPEIDAEIVEAACQMIMATREHRATGDSSVDLFIDVDMAILAAPWPEYARYADGVMREFAAVFGEPAYREGRVAIFLDPIIARGSVFVTPLYAPRNAGAMKNMAREREILASGGRFEDLEAE